MEGGGGGDCLLRRLFLPRWIDLRASILGSHFSLCKTIVDCDSGRVNSSHEVLRPVAVPLVQPC